MTCPALWTRRQPSWHHLPDSLPTSSAAAAARGNTSPTHLHGLDMVSKSVAQWLGTTAHLLLRDARGNPPLTSRCLRRNAAQCVARTHGLGQGSPTLAGHVTHQPTVTVALPREACAARPAPAGAPPPGPCTARRTPAWPRYGPAPRLPRRRRPPATYGTHEHASVTLLQATGAWPEVLLGHMLFLG